MKLLNKLKDTFKNSPDLIVKTTSNIDIIYLESLCSSDKINEYILKTINLNKSIAGPNTIEVSDYEEIVNLLENGFTIVNADKIYAIETKGDLIRSISSPTTEPDIHGPKDSFTESIQTNLGLIKRRIKSPDLISKDLVIGKYSKTKISVLYIDSICEDTMVNDVIDKLNNIDIDGIIDTGNIKQLIGNEDRSPLPTMQLTERPDKVSMDLLEGKIAILVDNSPFALMMPTFFVDFINPSVDTYSKNVNINFVKILRFICLITTLFLPAFYISLINYNQGVIPLDLLVNFAMQRSGVPFPSYIECIFVLILCAILRESDIRFPTNYGSSISIVGALIMGEAAVSAGVVSPIMIIVIALTYITSMVYTDQELINSFRHIRFITLFLVCILGLYGLFIGAFFFLIHLCSLTSLNKPYTYPLAPLDEVYLHKTFFRTTKDKDTKRSKLLTNKNYTKQGD